jgi:hypothetical protein
MKCSWKIYGLEKKKLKTIKTSLDKEMFKLTLAFHTMEYTSAIQRNG